MTQGWHCATALLDWFLWVMKQPVLTGMWIVAPEEDCWDQYMHAVVLLDTILHPAHLIPVYRADLVPTNFHFANCRCWIQFTNKLGFFSSFTLVLQIPDVTQPFSIMMDALLLMAEVILLQTNANEDLHPCAYFS